ncbi:MAG: Gfo/Idh/MocA family oxidoreductase [Acetobacteraceae bacterium]|nr:Gfo/Idh/MocA family oxidoreductase [Acetobacteraceae bacterium]
MRVAVIGCGYVADYYIRNMAGHPDFEVAGVYDRNETRRDRFAQYFSLPAYPSLDAALADPDVQLVFNLTNPISHFAVSAAAIRAGKHVYTEKPLGMTLAEARELVALAASHGVRIGAAPCNVLNATCRELGKAIRTGVIGRVRLVYANYDDGMIAPNRAPWNWRSGSGAPWPAADEFTVGCTYEHAGYALVPLAALFGPARTITAFASLQVPDKGIPIESMAPDFSVGCIEYDNGVVARLTAGLVAPEDKSLTVVGDRGSLVVQHLRNDAQKILISSPEPTGSLAAKARRGALRFGVQIAGWPHYKTYCRPVLPPSGVAGPDKPVDFLLGPQDMLDAIRTGRPHRLSGELAVHIVEIVEALQHPERFGHRRILETTFDWSVLKDERTELAA